MWWLARFCMVRAACLIDAEWNGVSIFHFFKSASLHRLFEATCQHSAPVCLPWATTTQSGIATPCPCLCAGHGEELEERRLRAKLRWARLRESVAELMSAHEARHPLKPLRIAGPATIRTAFLERRVAGRLRERAAQLRSASPAAADTGEQGGLATGANGGAHSQGEP